MAKKRRSAQIREQRRQARGAPPGEESAAMNRVDLMHRAAIEAAQRRRRLALWLEHFEAMQKTPTRTEEERRAKAEALGLMEQSYPR